MYMISRVCRISRICRFIWCQGYVEYTVYVECIWYPGYVGCIWYQGYVEYPGYVDLYDIKDM